jgi:hypothetical protein
MWRYLAGAAACFLFMTGAFLLWQGKAEQGPSLPPAPGAPTAAPVLAATPAVLRAPEATPKSREQKRFGRADKDDDGRITRAELIEPRRKAFAKLDANGNGSLSFEEWAVKTLDKFGGADKDASGWLTPAEYASTAPKPAKPKRCAC